jgi:hypothetical protein
MQSAEAMPPIHPEDIGEHLVKWRSALATGETFENEARVRRAADGGYRSFLIRGLPLRDERGYIVKWYGTMTDIEDRKRAEEAVHKANADLAHITRVITMGELTASIAHEVNQPLKTKHCPFSQAGRRGFESRLPLHMFNHLRGFSTPSKPSV